MGKWMSILSSNGKIDFLLKRNWLLAIIVILFTGFFYRSQASRLKVISLRPVSLPVPLKSIPFENNNWTGQDMPIPENIQKVAGNDDFINRLYLNRQNSNWVNIYLSYSGSPRTLLGHRPEICYVAGGWIHDSTQQSDFHSSTGKRMSCLIHHFHKPPPSDEEIYVLNFYILNGRVICNEKGFSGLAWRTPNIDGNPARYVAQIQISSVLENSVRLAASDFTDLILDFLPDGDGKVRVAKSSDTFISLAN
jgi:hypothetical protein